MEAPAAAEADGASRGDAGGEPVEGGGAGGAATSSGSSGGSGGSAAAGAAAAEAAQASGEREAVDGNARVHSVYFVLPVDMQGMLDFVLPEIMPGIIEMCRRHREFAASWPGGPGEMELTLRQSVEESGRGPLLHGMRLPQAEKLREHLAEFVEVEVVVDREAAARIQERERRNRPPPRPPPPALLVRCPPGARVRIAAEAPEEIERLQRGFSEWGDDARACLGLEGAVAAYRLVEAHGSWAVRVAITAEEGGAMRCLDWNPSNLRPADGSPALRGGSQQAEEGTTHSDAGDSSEALASDEVLLVNDEDMVVGDRVVFHSEGCWHAGRVVGPGDAETFTIDAADGRREENVPKRQIQMVLVMEAEAEPPAEGSVVLIIDDVNKARGLQRSRWTDNLSPCLGQLGLVVEAQDKRRMVVSCPAAPGPTMWHVSCLRVDKSEGLRCLDRHEHPLWWITNLERPKVCAQCGATNLREAYCCFRSSDCALCSNCAVPYLSAVTTTRVRSQHHLLPLTPVALPRGPEHSRWPCRGALLPGGCRGIGVNGAEKATGGACCAKCEVLICDACLADPSLGEASAETRRQDVMALPGSATRIAAALHAHPGDVFGFVEAGLFPRLATCLAGEPCARRLAHDLATWLAAPPPSRAQAGPVLVDNGEGMLVEANVIAEDCEALDGTWTDENEPGRWMRTIKDGLIFPPEEVAVEAGEKAGGHVVDVSGCGMSEFDGQYLPDGLKNGRAKFRKADGGVQTCNYSSGAWYLCHNHAGSWYQASSESDLPPSTGWSVGGRGQAPAPTVAVHTQGQGTKESAQTSSSAAPEETPTVARFARLPSVGTWLQAKPEEPEEAPAGTTILDLDGVWRREASGERIAIAGATLTWPDGDSTQISLAGADAFSMEFQGQVYHANLEDSGLRLVWSDGDVWVRAPESLQVHGLPEEGQPVNYKGFSGCTIKEVFSHQRVLINIPGVGDEEAAAGEYTLQDMPPSSDSKLGPDTNKAAKLERLGRDAFSAEFADAVRCAQTTPDGRITWADGGSAWVRMERCPRCPKGHILRRSRHTAPWRCDDCEERWTERRRLRCGACDYNICESCLAIRSWERGAPGTVGTGGAYGSFEPGTEAEVRVSGTSPRSSEWVRCLVEGPGEVEGTIDVTQLPPADAGGPGRRLQGLAPGRLRPRDLTASPGLVDALWRYASPNDVAIGIRTIPEIEGPRDGQLQHGQVFRVSEHRFGPDGVIFLRLADGRGWVFDRKPGVGSMCFLLRVRKAAEGSGDGQGSAGCCTVVWPETGGHAASPSRVCLNRLRPPFAAAAPRDSGCSFLRAELLRELKRGSQCSRRRVQGLLEGRANVLGVEGGEDVLKVALQHGCNPDVVEALLVAHAPLTGCPQDSPTAAKSDSAGSGSSTASQDPVRAILALGEPRLACLLADRGRNAALAAAEAMEGLAESETPPGATAANAGSAAAAEEFEAQRGAARACAASARHLAAQRETPPAAAEAGGSLAELLRQLGRELIVPLLQADKDVGLEPGSWLGTLLRALGAAGYEPTAAQVGHLAAAIAQRLTEEPIEAVHGILSFVRLFLDVFAPDSQSQAGGSPFMQVLGTAFRRHGALASIVRLADPGAALRVQRPGTDPHPLRAEAADLVARLRQAGGQPPDAADSAVAAVVSALPGADALDKLIVMLKQGSCTPYELGLHDAPKRVLPMFETDGRAWPWATTAPLDGPSMAALASKLQALLGMCETFPIAALNVRGDGLSCLLQPHVLALEGMQGTGRRELRAEPLLPLSDLERFVLHTTPISDEEYLAWCRSLCGRRIAERALRGNAAWRAATVVSFNQDTRLPRHMVRYEADGREAQLLLHLRNVVVLQSEESPAAVSTADGADGSSDAGPPASKDSLLFNAGCKVQARFEDGSWCRATVEQANDDGTFNVSWDNGTQTDTVKKASEIRAIPGGRPICQRVRVVQDSTSVAGVAIWEHASGAQDVVDQEGRYLAGVPRGSCVPEAQHARDSPGRPMPFEIRNLSMQERSSTFPVPSLERSFSAVDRNYRPRDFLYKNPVRKIGGPEGEPLQKPETSEALPAPLTLEQVRSGTPAPRLRVRFFSSPSMGSSKTASKEGGENPPEAADEEPEAPAPPLQPLPAGATVLQALLHFAPGKCASLPEKFCLHYKIEIEYDQVGPPPRTALTTEGLRSQSGVSRASNVGAVGMTGPVLALLRRLRRHLQGKSEEGTEVRWENGPLNRKLLDQLAQPLLTAAIAAPPWVFELPLAYPFLFERKAREQLLRCAGFGTSHAVLWLQRQSIEERYGDRLRRTEGQLEGRMDLTEHIVSDPQVFIGPARSDFITLPSRGDLLQSAERVVELTHDSKAMLEVKFADEGGFGDGVTQSFYTAVAAELAAFGQDSNSQPLCGIHGLWAEHLPESVVAHQGRRYLHSRRGLFPRPQVPGSPASEKACEKFCFLGRLMAKALRDGFVVPLSLCSHFFTAALGEDLPLSALPRPGDGCVGEFVGAAADFAADLRLKYGGLDPDAKLAAYQEEAQKPGWGARYLRTKNGGTSDWSFDEYVKACSITFCETGVGGQELCEGGSDRPVDAASLEEFVEAAAWWWLRDGVAAQVAAFRQGVEDVCETSAIWAFEADELITLFCGGSVEWTREELQQHLRPRGGLEARDMEMLIDCLERLPSVRREDFLEFVTACPRLPPSGLAALEITVAPAHPPGSFPRARTCTKELRLPKYESLEQLEERLCSAMDHAGGLYDDDRMG